MADIATQGYQGLNDLTDASCLATKRQDTERLRGVLKREWALNREYYNGNQWSFWNSQMLRVESLPIDGGPAWKIRLQSNQIKPGLASYVAQLIKTRPTIYAEPNSAGDADVKSAQMATSLFESFYDQFGLNAKAAQALMEAGLSGGFWNITWDALAGKPMTFVMGPDGQPIMDDELADVFLDRLALEAQQVGKDPEELQQMAKKTVYLGDIAVRVMTAENVLLDPGCDKFEDAKWAMCRHALDPDEIKARWGFKVLPDALPAGGNSTPMAFQNIEERKPKTIRNVYVMYIRPHPAVPKGRYVAWIEGPDQILQDIPWPYPFRELPLVKFPGIYRPDSPYDDPIVNEVRPLQKDLNKTLSQMVEHKNLTVRPQMLAPIGSLRTKLTSEPGAVFEFNPIANMIPTWRPMPELPQSMFAHLQLLQASIDKFFNRIPSSRDQLPARADGGALLEGMQEATADQISTVILGLEDSLARAGMLMITLAQKFYIEPRLMRIRGAGGSTQVKKFEQADIAGGFTFRPRYGTGLPRSRQGKHDAILALIDAGVLSPQEGLKELDLAGYKVIQAKMMADEDQAFREHDKILRGQPINSAALQAAQAQLNQFNQQAYVYLHMIQHGAPVDLDGDGQPDTPQAIMQQLQQQQAQLQQALQDAPWQPLDYENWDQHIDTHAGYMKTPEFESLPPEVQAIFVQHYNLTYQKKIAIMYASAEPGDAPKINVRAMATVSAATMSKILSKTGVDSPPEEVGGPPLDTQVIDTLNQPKVDGSGNDPLTQADQLLTMQQAQDKHELAQAQAEEALGAAQLQGEHAQTSAAMQQASSAQAVDHAQQKHDQATRHAEELHQEKLKQMRKPKPAAKKPSGGR